MSTVTDTPAAGAAGEAPIDGARCFWEVSEGRVGEFLAMGLERRYFFPHRIHRLPKGGPDGHKLGVRMIGERGLDGVWELVIYAAPHILDEFPRELFFDRELMWHEQHFGLPGQVSLACMVLDGERAWSFGHLSDLVPRIKRRPGEKSRINNRFRGWMLMTMNAVAHFARQSGAVELRTPTSELAREHTDPAREVGWQMFRRVYDRGLRHLDGVRRENGWWVVDLERNRDRIVAPERRTERVSRPERVVCLCHDVERGLGHRDVDPSFARAAEAESPSSLPQMLTAERQLGVRATYNVVGSIMGEVRPQIEEGGHCLAFHSFDHNSTSEREQLTACRRVDYRLKGYRPPRSEIGPELPDAWLVFQNFEWLASSVRSLGSSRLELRDRLVRVPIHLDDFSLHDTRRSYDDWEREALALVEGRPFTALCLHDCYAPHWLPHYGRFLERLQERAALRTVDEVAADITLAAGV